VDVDGDGIVDYYTVEAVEAGNIGKDITIPGNINGKPVKIVTDLSSGWASNLENVIIKEGVEEIKAKAFAETRKLATIELPSTIKKIEDSAFAGTWSGIGGDLSLYQKKPEIKYNGTKAQWDTVVANSNQNGSQWEEGLEEGTKVICTDGTYTLTKVSGNVITGRKYTWEWTSKN
jgi:hypothetical protein